MKPAPPVTRYRLVSSSVLRRHALVRLAKSKPLRVGWRAGYQPWSDGRLRQGISRTLPGVMRSRDIDNAGWWLGITLVALYALLRTMAAGELFLIGWTGLAVILALVSPLAGLTVVGALGPFTEAQTADGRITAIPFLLAAVGTGLLIRLALTRPLPRPHPPLVLAILLLAGTALGVAHTALDFGSQLAIQAAQAWVPGIGGALTILLAAAWVSWRGDARPLYVALASIGLAALISLVDYVAGGAILAGPMGWLLREHNPTRLTEIIPAPNAAAAIFVLGVAMGGSSAAFAERLGLRFVGVGLAVVSSAALFFTFSRSGWLAVGLALAVLGWHWRRRLGLVAVGVALGVISLAVAAGLVREVPLVADQLRLDAWTAAARMWLADPLLGRGFHSFEWLHATYGSTSLDAPHNEWLRLFAEEGLVVGTAGLAFAFMTPLAVLRAGGWLAAGAAAAAAGLFLMAAFNNPFLYTQVNVPAFLIVGVGLGLALRERTERELGDRHASADG
jgi:O-antigen ligase